MDMTIRWMVTVSQETDQSLRSFLSDHGMRDDDLSKVVERAVQKEIRKQTAADVKRRNADLAGDDLQALINGTVAAVRMKRKPR
jgi:ribbon-helix-helix protein